MDKTSWTYYLAQTVQRVVVKLRVGELLQHVGQNVVQRLGPDRGVQRVKGLGRCHPHLAVRVAEGQTDGGHQAVHEGHDHLA